MIKDEWKNVCEGAKNGRFLPRERNDGFENRQMTVIPEDEL
jgi:hypothetical protein